MSYLNAYERKEDFKKVVWLRLLQFKQVLNKAAVDKRKKLALAQATVGDQAAAAQLGAMLAL
jgi:hypothetical protein